MNFLVITDDLYTDTLTPELKKLYSAYQTILSKRSEFRDIKRFRNSKSEFFIKSYNIKCQELASTIKYINYCPKKQKFIVRPTVDGKRIYLGSEKDFDDACWLLSEYLKIKMQEKNETVH